MMWLNSQRSVSALPSCCNGANRINPGPCIPPSSQSKRPLGVLALSPTATWPFSPCKQRRPDLCDQIRSDQTDLSEPRQQVG
jgi:hypothetical protein